MIVENKPNFYIGTVTYVENDPNGLLKHDKLYLEAVVTVPGVFENVLAFPGRNQLDEPKVGDLVVVCSYDPLYNSYCTYEKLKENDFLGFRASGKMVKIDEEKIVVGVYDKDKTYKDEETPDVSELASLEMTKTGEINIHAKSDINVTGDSNVTITISGDANIKVKGNSGVEISGNANIKVSGSTKIDSPDVTVTGGKLTVKGQATPDMQGPFLCVKNCIFSGATIAGSVVSGT